MNTFITGSDQKQAWMIPWFVENYRKHDNKTKLVFVNFGVTKDTLERVVVPLFDEVITLKPMFNSVISWSYKPHALLTVPEGNKCWLDLDCEILGNIDDIFNYIRPGMIGMSYDYPWIKRRGGLWYNSGVILCRDNPFCLELWNNLCGVHQHLGDQEVLYFNFSEEDKRNWLYAIPNKYNWLRLQLLDKQDDPNKKIMHWTGDTGKKLIWEKILCQTQST